MNEPQTNIKTGTAKYYSGYTTKGNDSVPAKISFKNKIAAEIDKIFENKEELNVYVDLEAKKIWIQKI